MSASQSNPLRLADPMPSQTMRAHTTDRSRAPAIDTNDAPTRPANSGVPSRVDDREHAVALPPPGRRAPGPDGCGLCFEQPGGPLVIVCGLHGGAGTSTLAYALAAQAAEESPPARVLLCESDAAAGDLAALCDARSRSSLSDLAVEFQAGRRPSGFLASAGALRVITGAPAPAPAVDEGAVAGVLGAARRRHAFTVVDAGTLRAPGTRELLTAATHVIWVLVERPGAAARARTLLACPLAPAVAARQLLAVRGARRRALAAPQRRELRRLGEDHCERLVFVPDARGASGERVDLADARVRATLTELARFVTGRCEG